MLPASVYFVTDYATVYATSSINILRFLNLRNHQINRPYTIDNLLSQSLMPPTNSASRLDSLIPAHLRFDRLPSISDVINVGGSMVPWNYGAFDMTQNGVPNTFPQFFPFHRDIQLGM